MTDNELCRCLRDDELVSITTVNRAAARIEALRRALVHIKARGTPEICDIADHALGGGPSGLEDEPIVRQCAAMFAIHPRDLVSKYRYGFLLPARYALCKALRLKGWSFGVIGRFLSRDHSTIMNSVKRAEYMMERDPEYDAKVQALAKMYVDSEAQYNG